MSVLFVIVLVLRRLGLARSARRRQLLEERLRPAALALLDEDGELPPMDMPPADAAIFAELLGRFGRTLRGSATSRLALWFAGSGAIHHATRELSRRAAWRRAAAAYALGDMGSPWASGDLLAALRDDDATVRAAAARSLGRLAVAEAVVPILTAQAAGLVPRLVAGQALLAIGPAAVPSLLELVGSVDAHERAAACELVGLIGGAIDEGPLVSALSDAAADVRVNAARALGRLGAEDAAARLRELLDDRIPAVRAAAAEALGEIGDDLAVGALLRNAREDEFDAARAAARAVARIDPGSVRAGGGAHLDEAGDLLAL